MSRLPFTPRSAVANGDVLTGSDSLITLHVAPPVQPGIGCGATSQGLISITDAQTGIGKLNSFFLWIED